MFRQNPPMQLLTDGWWEKLLPSHNADAPSEVNPNPNRNIPIVITDSFANIDLLIQNYAINILITTIHNLF
jgi:hypothetical protein